MSDARDIIAQYAEEIERAGFTEKEVFVLVDESGEVSIRAARSGKEYVIVADV